MARWRRIHDAIREGTQDGLRDVARIIQDEASLIISEEAIDTGDLLHSDEIRENPFQIVVAWTAEHAKNVNDGQRPHWPPEEPLREWVKRNVRIQVTDAGREPVFKPRLKGETKSPREREIDAVTFLVRRKIAREGTEPVHFAERAIDKATPRASPTIVEGINARLEAL